MIVKIRYIGSTSPGDGLTNNAVYVVVGWNTGSGVKPIILNDNNIIYASGIDISDDTKWELVSITSTGEVQIFP